MLKPSHTLPYNILTPEADKNEAMFVISCIAGEENITKDVEHLEEDSAEISAIDENDVVNVLVNVDDDSVEDIHTPPNINKTNNDINNNIDNNSNIEYNNEKNQK